MQPQPVTLTPRLIPTHTSKRIDWHSPAHAPHVFSNATLYCGNTLTPIGESSKLPNPILASLLQDAAEHCSTCRASLDSFLYSNPVLRTITQKETLS